MSSNEEATFMHHTSCPECGGSDCLAVYTDGGKYCFGECNKLIEVGKGSLNMSKLEFSDKAEKKKTKMIKEMTFESLRRGHISKELCLKYGYAIGEYDFYDKEDEEWETKWVQIANYRNDKGQIIAQKLRTSDKEFKFVGSPSKELLWGKHLWRNKGGKQIIITEGEIDCLSVAHCYDGKYPVVSLSAGVNTAKAGLMANYDFLESFDKIILWFDSDDAGQSALEECKSLFSPNKCYYVPYDSQYKDANDVLKAEGREGVIKRLYEAKEHREDAIVRGSDFSFEELMQDIAEGSPLPYPILQEKTMGIRDGELWIFTAGSGIGKSTIVTEVAKYMLDNDPRVKLGTLYLEESKGKTADRFLALDHNVPLKNLRVNHSLIPQEKAYETYMKYFKTNRINFYDHFGSVATEHLMKKIQYLVLGEGCNTIILDHISIAVSGLETDEGERKTLDVFMTELRSFVERTKCRILAIVHLKRAKGKDFNEGAQVSLTDLRGSASLEQLSDAVIAVERNQQGDDPYEARIRVLKARESGETGEADCIRYAKDTGRYQISEGGNEDEGSEEWDDALPTIDLDEDEIPF